MQHGNISINSKGHLEISGCDAVDLAREFGTPLYVMDESLIRQNCRLYREELDSLHPDSGVIYAGKAFMTMTMCRIAEQEGLYLDVVSGGELYTAIKAGFPAERIYFHGNNKSYEELKMALEYNVGQIVVDNFHEMEILNDLTKKLRRRVNILLRITPGIEAHTHDYIKTGQLDSKFGFGLENGQAMMAVESALGIKGVRLVGFHCHIGSQIFETEPFALAAEVMMKLVKSVKSRFGYITMQLDFGGGFGVKYTDDDKPLHPREYLLALVEAVKRWARELDVAVPRILVEPGRAIVGPAGITLYTIGAIKDIPGVRKYVSVDGGMSDNIRPALYGAKYSAVLANKAGMPVEETVSIAGKCCESGDMLIWDIKLPRVSPGDILAVFCTGAYHYSMASNYNMIPRPAVVFVRDGNARLVVKRETYRDLLRNEIFEPEKKAIPSIL
ncbi:diaminopimelate decarboxylase [Thermosediminibacter litoriperuensis]|uniref:Diaminopimelate decarboxylase n=1 Tax=Thermosediminibacter litoriperuensis TaxID=291989 RepID=A0A5S5B1E2_9FIRM|nr:diaminopimelate decarboxylase [Thermosediminibacter litoriperuensis]TYP59893.1 diaminopimelate decarboxylase [Thermosediminibacter litoriperuensis]